MDKEQRTYMVLEEIWAILEKNADILPTSIPKETIKKYSENYPDKVEKILKRIRGIIKGFNAENSERKLKNVSALLQSLDKRSDS